MKLVCDSCGTKYSIGDDKVAGKVFKIRCKKCSQVIVVRGSAPVIATTVDEWHAVIDGKQQGPFSREQLHAFPHETLVWRDGMADWVELGSLGPKTATPRIAEQIAAEISGQGPRTNAVQDERPKLVAERNESSALFTLSNLAQLARPERQQASAPKPTIGIEGSGLLDIRSLASSLAPKPATASIVDEIPVAAPIGFGEPIVIVPIRRGGLDRRLVLALIATLTMLATLAVVLVVVVTRESEPVASAAGSEQVAAIVTPPSKATNDGTSGVATTTTTASTTTLTGTPTTTTPTTPTTTTTRTDTTRANTTNPTRTNANTTRTTPTTNTSRSNTTNTTNTNSTTRTNTKSTTRTNTTRLPPLTPPKQECTDVSCMVNNYADPCCAIYKNGGIPEQLDKPAIATGLTTIPAKACKGSGEVSLSIKVSPAGSVASVTHRGPSDTPLAQCVAAAARRGRFAKTQRGGSFGYIWRF